MTVSRLDALIMEQEQLKTLDRRTIEAIQLDKLNRLLAREKERGGFYRGLPEKFGSLSELAQLPFTTAEDLAREAPGLLLGSQSRIQRVLSDATSGTTGAAKRVFYTAGDLENTVRLYTAGLGELIFPGSTVMICFPFSGPYGLGELIAEAITRLGARPLKLGASLSYGEYRDVLAHEKPDSFVGTPVQLLSLLRVCGKGSLRRGLVSGDACPESVVGSCEAILGSRLFPHYGSREMGMAGAITCPAHEGMHLRENAVIAEIIDDEGKVLPRGAWGELVITTVGMEALPLLRYRTGDVTRLLPGPCPCGSETVRLDRVRRKGDSAIAELDERLFALPELVDYSASFRMGRLELHALVTGTLGAGPIRQAAAALFPEAEIGVTVRPVTDHDRALYAGKRILRQDEPRTP